MNLRPRRVLSALVLLGALAGCDGASVPDVPAPGGKLVKSDKPRLSASTVPMADVTAQSHANAAFAFELYAQLRSQPGNLFFSPYSISSALAMTYAGAQGDTATAMAGALHYDLPGQRLHDAFNALDQALASRAQAGTSRDGGPFKLNVANAVWAQQGLALQPAFLDTLAQEYGAGVRTEDFARQPEPARADINAWVDASTSGKIPELLQAGAVDASTRLVLANAVYFNGSWKEPFEADQTRSEPFHALDGTSSQVSMMHHGLETAYASGSGWEAVELPYSNPDLTLTVIVPAAGSFGAVEGQLSGAFLDGVLAAEQVAAVDLGLPRFDARSHVSLHDALTALGMQVAFSDRADFSGIDGARDLLISDVIHEATVSVDEKGTEAAAATAVVMAGSAAPSQVVHLTIDRPFFLVLRDVPTGAVLFVGRIVQP